MIIDTNSLIDKIGLGVCFVELSLSLIVNSFALRLLIKKKRDRKVSDLLIMHLCICEFLYAVWEMVNYSLLLHLKKSKGTVVHVVGEAILFSSIYQSILCVTLDRVLAVRLNIRYRAMVTKRRCLFLLPVLWMISIAVGLLIGLTSERVLLAMWISWDSIAGFTMISGYSYIFIIVVSQRRRFSGTSSLRNQLRLQVPLCIGGTFFCLWLIPDLIINIDRQLYCVWILVLWFANIIFDPMVYVISSHYFRKRKASSYSVQSRSSATSWMSKRSCNEQTSIPLVERK